MSELPKFLITTGWIWRSIEQPDHPSDGFWIGIDRSGNSWLTKLRYSFNAYREIVFSRIAQHLGWSCQSSIFIKLDRESAKLLRRKEGEVHAAHWYMQEHLFPPCTSECQLTRVVGREHYTVEDIAASGIRNMIDWPKSELASYIFGGYEPPGHLFTSDHDLVIIDSEKMFSSQPRVFDSVSWLRQPDGSRSLSGHELAKEVCAEFGSLTLERLESVLEIPQNVQIELNWSIEDKLHNGVKFANTYLRREA